MIDLTYLRLKRTIECLRLAESILLKLYAGELKLRDPRMPLSYGSWAKLELLLERCELNLQPRIDHIIRNARNYRASKPAQHPLWRLVQWERRTLDMTGCIIDMTGGIYAQ